MARSAYIYVLRGANGLIVGTFTVLHELRSYVERNNGYHYTAHRFRDGHPEFPPTPVELDEPPGVPRLTRYERLQAAADAGVDTWEDYRGER